MKKGKRIRVVVLMGGKSPEYEISLAFIAIQGMLELAGLKYTGSGVLASALGMDK